MIPNKTIVVLKFVRNKFLIFLLTFFLCFGIPFLIITLLPIFIMRKLVSHLSKIIRPDLGKILTAMSSTIATDDFTNYPKWSILITFQIKGTVDIDMLKSKMVEKVIGVRKVGNDLKNIELKQYPYKWMGFIFWKWDENFDISNHVKYYNHGRTNGESEISKEHLNEIQQELLFRHYPEKRSPWEILILHNIQSNNHENETFGFFRCHHSIGDGYSLHKLCLEICDESPKECLHTIVFPKVGFCKRLLYYLAFAKVPYELAECAVESFGSNDWKIADNKMSRKYFGIWSESISMDDIKEVANILNCSINTVILSAVTTAFRQAMVKQKGKVPNQIHIGLPFPMKGHPDKLRNYYSGVLMSLPIGEADPKRRLKKIEQTLDNFKNSTFPAIAFLISMGVGSMFHWMIPSLAETTIFAPMTAMGSMFPGSKIKTTQFGHDIVDVYFALGPHFGNFGINFTTLTYNNNFKMRLMVNESILNKKSEVEQMTIDVIQEFHVLKNSSTAIV